MEVSGSGQRQGHSQRGADQNQCEGLLVTVHSEMGFDSRGRRIEEGLKGIEEGCEKRRYRVSVIERRIGKLMGRNSRAAGLFEVNVDAGSNGGAKLRWRKKEQWREAISGPTPRPQGREISRQVQAGEGAPQENEEVYGEGRPFHYGVMCDV